ncbi:T3SS effector HopA1 family protein [Flavobacterium lindanitolerans]|uniref:T3SS effector HopA1 family protein n=1 Tax=Flavobacterium lindanitolerans TaxID=428988 RepID=UPI0031E28481
MFKDSAIIKELTRLVNQLEITSSHIVFRGKQYAVTPDTLQESLTGILYSECYALKESYQSDLLHKPNYSIENDVNFMRLLSQNNHSKDRIEQGWQVKTNYPGGYVEVVRQAESHIVPLNALKETGGQNVAVFFPKEDQHRQPTFYYVFGNQNLDFSKNLVRVYWNITSEGAPVLIDSITKKLNRYNIPFLFKCLNHPQLYFRRDAAVLYIEDTLQHLLGQLLPELYEDIKEFLEEDVPLFSYRYQKGMGMAENPSSQESFGMNRMAIVASVLANPVPKNPDAGTLLQEIATAFQQKGIHPETTFLNKGTKKAFN